MTAQVGYTAKQAEMLKWQLDRDMAAIEDRVRLMGSRVTDHSYGAFFGGLELEQLRERVEELKAIVDRRTR